MVTANKLLDAAEKRMRKSGYNAVSFRDLAADAKIKSASVHYHFPRKEDLGLALVARYQEHFFAALKQKASSANSAHERLQAICDVYRSALKVDDAICLCGMLGAESPGLPPAVSAVVKDFFEANIRWVDAALTDELTAAARMRFAKKAIASLQGGMMLATALGDPSLLDDVSKSILDSLKP